MNDQYLFEVQANQVENLDGDSPLPVPILIPKATLSVSGLYVWKSSLAKKEELRLDVDQHYPQMVASGTISELLFSAHWIANLTATGSNSWTGNIWYKSGNVSNMPYTKVEIEATPSFFSNQKSATVTFSGERVSNLVRTYKYESAYFHPVEFEFDSVEGTTAVTTVQTHAHPNRPDSLPNEELSIETVYRRAGFNVKKSGGNSIIPIEKTGGDSRWSDMEMHDAMQTYWSRFIDKPQWSIWVFFAALHEQGPSLGGIMFDDIGPNHRQGTAIFNDAFISQPPIGDANPEAWVQRMRFWTACHEIGHSFNLAHSWQKHNNSSWIPVANEPEARSFMNYPFNVSGGQTAFFEDFEYRFSNGELLFMRHAPAKFVQMGNADWFDHHGFQQANVSPEPALKLELRVNRETALFEFLEPVVLELKLTNISSQPQLIEEKLLALLDHAIVMIKKDKKPARQFERYAQYCWQPKMKALMPGESVYESLFVSAGKNGWDIAEPGYYTVQMALHLEDREQDLVSNPLRLRIAPPRGYDEEFLAQDFFSNEVGRILTFDGSRFLSKGNNILREVTQRLSDRRVAIHAEIALGNPLTYQYKQLIVKNGQSVETSRDKIVQTSPPDEQEALIQLNTALAKDMSVAAETLGHIDYKYYVEHFSQWLANLGNTKEAANIQSKLHQTLSERKVLPRVLQEIEKRRDIYEHQK